MSRSNRFSEIVREHLNIFFPFSHRLRCQKIQGPEPDFDRTLTAAVGVVSVRFWSNFDAYL